MDVAEAQKSPQSHRSRALQSRVRKQQLIGSTIECIDQFGLSQTTIAKIAQHAGVSQGVVIFHFQTKELLLEQVFIQGIYSKLEICHCCGCRGPD